MRDRTTTLGATRTSRRPAGTRRLRTSPTTVSLSCKYSFIDPRQTAQPLSQLQPHTCKYADKCSPSLSEWGCITNGRDFNELQALMSNQMTSVYSGGLMYEYTLEGNGFGIVKIDPSTGSIAAQPEFAKFASAMSKYPAPTGAGGAASTTHSVPCPTMDSIWEVDPSAIPVMPAQAQQYMQNGAGAGPGLKGDGSQNAGGSGTSTASTTGGQPSPTTTKNAAAGLVQRGPLDASPFVVSALALLFTLAGTLAL
jgi:1,3-beta-glucanosyltransferase GAS5